MSQDMLLLAGVYVIGFIFTIIYVDNTSARLFIAVFWPLTVPLFWIAVGIVAVVDWVRRK